MDLSKFTMPRINYLRENLNLTDDEIVVFDMLSKHKSRLQIADRLQVSIRTVDNRIKDIKNKMSQIGSDNT